jgi:hypothetical protein
MAGRKGWVLSPPLVGEVSAKPTVGGVMRARPHTGPASASSPTGLRPPPPRGEDLYVPDDDSFSTGFDSRARIAQTSPSGR